MEIYEKVIFLGKKCKPGSQFFSLSGAPPPPPHPQFSVPIFTPGWGKALSGYYVLPEYTTQEGIILTKFSCANKV